MKLEGIISKRRDLPYRSGRNGDWTKSKCVMADPFVVIGYVPSKVGSGTVGSLVLGFYETGAIVYTGRVGTGFALAEARAMADGFRAIRRRTPPLSQRLTREQRFGVAWVEPRLVAQITYRDVTADAVLRHAAFEHFREDKRPDEIVRPAPLFHAQARTAAAALRRWPPTRQDATAGPQPAAGRAEGQGAGQDRARCWALRRTGACAGWPRSRASGHTSVQQIWREAGLTPHGPAESSDDQRS